MSTPEIKYETRGRPRKGETAAEAKARRIKSQKAAARKAAKSS